MSAGSRLQTIAAQLPWVDLLRDAAPIEAHDFADTLAKEAQDAEATNQTEAFEGWRALSRLFWPRLKDIDPIPKRRGALTGDQKKELPWSLTSEEVDLAKAVRAEITDPECLAHINDLLWLVKKEASAARSASLAYLDSADRLLDPMHWNASEERYRRAISLAAAVDSRGPEFAACVTRIEQALEKLGGSDPRLLTLRLSSLLFNHKAGNQKRIAELLEARGNHGGLANEERYELDSKYFEAAQRVFDSIGETEAAVRCGIAAGEAMASHASERFAQGLGGRLAAPHFMKKAIKLLRKVEGGEVRAQELHVILLKWQLETVPELFSTGEPITISPQALSILNSIVGATFIGSIVNLARMMAPVSTETLRTFAEDQVKSPLFAIMPFAWNRSDGKLDERQENVPFQGPVPEHTIKQVMHHYARLCWSNHGAHIYSALGSIQKAHGDDQMDLSWLVYHSRFVPEGRRGIFKRGLEAGLQFDLVASMHFLIPQVENSLRHLLTNNGVASSRLDDDDTQDEHLLPYLLAHEKLEELLGKDVMFDLAGLLNERAGANLRNLLAHGMASEGQLSQLDSLYLWWLILRLCVMHVEVETEATAV